MAGHDHHHAAEIDCRGSAAGARAATDRAYSSSAIPTSTIRIPPTSIRSPGLRAGTRTLVRLEHDGRLTGLGIGAHAPEDLVDEYSPDVATIVSTQSAMQICFSRVFERAAKAAVDRGDFDLTGWVTAEQTLAGRDPEFDPEFSTVTWDRINAAMSEYADLLASGIRPN